MLPTFLFSSIDDEQADSVATFVAAIRAASSSHGGDLFEAAGTGAYASFSRPSDAVAAAAAAQRSLESAQIRPRMAVHTGAAERRDGKFVGQALYRCARIMAAAHPGQVVLSSETRKLAGGELPEATSVRSLGTHRLKDMADADQLFQLLARELRSEFPPLKSVEVLYTNVPVPVTSFIGRAEALAAAREVLSRLRLLTLVGSGGTGKTRLALQLASESLELFPQGAWFVDLAPVSDAQLVPQALANALGVRDQPGTTLMDGVIDFLASRAALVILDNCEHLKEACGTLATAILTGCASTRLVATSRQPLGVEGEQTFEVSPLTTVDPASLPRSANDGGAALISAIESLEASRLFVDRARLLAPAFSVTAENARAIAEVCHQVDGIPLAIELAAARVSLLSPQQLAERIGERFRVLARGGRGALPRHQTLRAVVDWSYDLLSASERAVFDRLSVFAGGFTLPAAVKVSTSPDTAQSLAVTLEDLAAKSLLTRENVARDNGRPPLDPAAAEYAADAPRYRMLVTLRQYALEKLGAGADEVSIRQRHADWFVQFAEIADVGIRGSDQVWWLRRFMADYDNLRAALAFSRSSPSGADIALRLANATSWFWFLKGFLGEGRAAIGSVVATAPAPNAARELRLAYARALINGGMLAAWQGDGAAAGDILTRGLALALELEDRSSIANAQNWLGVVAKGSGDIPGALPLHEEALRLAKQDGDRWLEAFALFIIGTLLLDTGEVEPAVQRFEESVRVFTAVGDDWGRGLSITFLGEVARVREDQEAAAAYFAESLALQRKLGEKWMAAANLYNLASVVFNQGDVTRAMSLFQEAITVADEMGNKPLVALAALGASRAIGALGDATTAAMVLGAVGSTAQGMEAFMSPAGRADIEHAHSSLREALGASFEPTYEQGKQLSLEAAVGKVLGFAASSVTAA